MSHYDLEDFDGLPHPEVRLLITRLRGEEYQGGLVQRYLHEAGLIIPYVTDPINNIRDAIALIPEDWWWHISHLEAEVIPTTPGPGELASVISNGRRHDKQGRPIRYSGDCHHNRKAIPAAICEAMLKASYNLPAGFAVRATATEDDDPEVVRARQERLATRKPMPG